MRPKTFDFDPDNTDADGIFTTASISESGSITMDGALVSGGTATMDYARRIAIVSAGNDSGITFTITGTDEDGLSESEEVTGANSDTAESTEYFKTVTDITASGSSDGNVTIGAADEFVSQAIPLDAASDSAATTEVDITGDIVYTLQETFTDIRDSVSAIQSAQWMVINKPSVGARAMRFVVNSFTDTAEAQLFVSQPSRG